MFRYSLLVCLLFQDCVLKSSEQFGRFYGECVLNCGFLFTLFPWVFQARWSPQQALRIGTPLCFLPWTSCSQQPGRYFFLFLWWVQFRTCLVGWVLSSHPIWWLIIVKYYCSKCKKNYRRIATWLSVGSFRLSNSACSTATLWPRVQRFSAMSSLVRPADTPGSLYSGRGSARGRIG